MKNKVLSNSLILSSFLLIIFSSCRRDYTPPALSIKSIEIKNEGQFDFENGLTYAVIDTETYELNLTTEPNNVIVFYSINGGEIQQKFNDFIEIDSNDTYISFFSTKNGNCMTNGNRLDFGFQTDSLVSEISVYPNPTDSIVSYKLESRIRGVLNSTLYSITGAQLKNKSVFIASNLALDTLNLRDLDYGLYFLKSRVGNTLIINRILKK